MYKCKKHIIISCMKCVLCCVYILSKMWLGQGLTTTNTASAKWNTQIECFCVAFVVFGECFWLLGEIGQRRLIALARKGQKNARKWQKMAERWNWCIEWRHIPPSLHSDIMLCVCREDIKVYSIFEWTFWSDKYTNDDHVVFHQHTQTQK